MKNSLIILVLFFWGADLKSQNFTEKVWVGCKWSSNEFKGYSNGFVTYFFSASSNILETNKSAIKYHWKYKRNTDIIRVIDIESGKKTNYKVVKSDNDSLILESNKNVYYFYSMNDRDTCYVNEEIIKNQTYYDSKDSLNSVRIKENGLVEYFRNNAKIEVKEGSKWEIVSFRGYQFLVINPGVYVFSIINDVRTGYILKSINNNNIDYLYPH